MQDNVEREAPILNWQTDTWSGDEVCFVQVEHATGPLRFKVGEASKSVEQEGTWDAVIFGSPVSKVKSWMGVKGLGTFPTLDAAKAAVVQHIDR